MSLPGVDEARTRMLAKARPLGAETVPLRHGLGRVLAGEVRAHRDQPPFDASSMDGWAVRSDDLAQGVVEYLIVGESAAGRGWPGRLDTGQAVRISTGAPLPAGACAVVIQEDVQRSGDNIRIAAPPVRPAYVRPEGCDFTRGTLLLDRGVRLTPWSLALAAASGAGDLEVARRPRVAILATGDELAAAGTAAGDHQIYDAAGPAIAAACAAWGAEAAGTVSAPDEVEAILEGVGSLSFDLLVTIGGASVGDHDLVKPALRELGLVLEVEGISVRPGRPTWFGALGSGALVLGLPGNPASALVCAELFLRPLLAALQGEASPVLLVAAQAEAPVPSNGPREQYLRGRARVGPGGDLMVGVADDQDSSLVSVLAGSNALVRRRPGAPEAAAGELVEVMLLQRPEG